MVLTWAALDWAVRVHAAGFLALAGLAEQAAALEALPELVGDQDLPAAVAVLDEAARAAALRVHQVDPNTSIRHAWASADNSGILAVWRMVSHELGVEPLRVLNLARAAGAHAAVVAAGHGSPLMPTALRLQGRLAPFLALVPQSQEHTP